MLAESLTRGAPSGMRVRDWFSLLYESRGKISPCYWPRVVFLSFQSSLNELLYLEEERQLSTRIEEQEPPAPIFVLGFWRSGTSFLHQLLCLDSRWSFPTMVQVQNPHTFFFIEGCLQGLRAQLGRRLYLKWAKLIWGEVSGSHTRLQDEVRAGAALPEEDEYAMVMMKQSWDLDPMLLEILPRYYGYLSLRSLDPERIQDWQRSWLRFVKKLTLRNMEGSPLVLKSGAHTAKVRYLLELFPRARFVHIHRHPFELFQSFRRHSGIIAARPPDFVPTGGFDEGEFVRLYETVYSAFLKDRELIPKGQLHEVRYADLCVEPVSEIEKVYQALGLPDFEVFRKVLEHGVDERRGYRRNSHSPLSTDQKEFLHTALLGYFDEFGYRL